MKLSELFEKHPERWSKNVGGPNNCGCMVTAPEFLPEFKIPTLSTGDEWRILEIISNKFKERLDPSQFADFEGVQIGFFNDHPDTTLADVISVLKEAGL